MAISQVVAIFITNFLWLSLSSSLSRASDADINCLRTIKSQLHDPNGFLYNWEFGNRTAGYICKFTGVSCWHDDENRVLTIKLPDFGLQGEFPRGIKNCTSLTGLDLSRNSLSGTLPSDISMLIGLVTSLDLSFNKFSGEIPPNLANISYLNTLRLNNNRFTGLLPPELALLGRIKEFSVANSLLRGPVPRFNSPSITRSSYDNNLGLCGLPLDPCPSTEGHVPTIVIGASVGAAIFAPVGAGIGCFCLSRKEKQRRRISPCRNKLTKKASLFPDLHP